MEEEMIIRKATAMVPNMFTVGNMALGFFAILAAVDGRWVAAPVAVFIAHALDILDGRIARWMRVSSAFGGEFDSFADWVSFGIAPAIMIYLLALKDFGRPGFLLVFLYVLAGAFRLARFNLKAAEPSDGSPSLTFTGLPIPVAGGFIAILVLLFGLYQNEHPGRTFPLLYNKIPMLRAGIPIIVFSLSFLMVSKIPFSTFKRTHFFRPQSYQTFMLTLFVGFMIYAYPQNTIFFMYAGYILTGFLGIAIRAYRLKRRTGVVLDVLK
jgi:CDP-diacylglycerol--serine O-phosphatidyltransferase